MNRLFGNPTGGIGRAGGANVRRRRAPYPTLNRLLRKALRALFNDLHTEGATSSMLALLRTATAIRQPDIAMLAGALVTCRCCAAQRVAAGQECPCCGTPSVTAEPWTGSVEMPLTIWRISRLSRSPAKPGSDRDGLHYVLHTVYSPSALECYRRFESSLGSSGRLVSKPIMTAASIVGFCPLLAPLYETTREEWSEMLWLWDTCFLSVPAETVDAHHNDPLGIVRPLASLLILRVGSLPRSRLP